SGFVGKVTRAIDDNEVEFELAPNVRARLLRSAIAEVRSRGEPVKDAPAAPKPAAEAKAPAKKPASETKAKS
ncbi:MAG: preprotein translocase subunit YajC, partial [Methylocystis sp.]